VLLFGKDCGWWVPSEDRPSEQRVATRADSGANDIGAAGTPRARDASTSVAAGALLLAASNLTSRILGYGRDIVLGSYEGSSPAAGAYFAAFQLPDLLNYLLAGGALSIAFLPLYTRARGSSEAAGRDLLGAVLGSLSIAALLATAIVWLYTDPIIGHLYPKFSPELRALTSELTRIVLPAQVFFVAGGILNATLLARGRFLAAALAPLLYNLAIISCGIALHPQIGVRGFAVGVLIGSIAGPFLAPLVSCLHARVPLAFRCAPLDPGFRRYLWIAAPLMLGQSLLTVDEWFDRFFGALIAPNVIAWLSYARKLMLVPVAVVGQAIAAAALPTLARLYTEGRLPELNRSLTDSLRAGLGLGVLLSVPLAAFAEPIVVLIYQRGEFSPTDSREVATLLRVLALAAPSWILQQILVRAFYARGDTWRPMLLGTVMVGVALPAYAYAAQSYGAIGLAFAGVFAMAANVMATLGLARHLHAAPPLGSLLDSLTRSTGISALSAAGAWWLCERLTGLALWGRLEDASAILANLGHLAAAGALYSLLALPLALHFGDPPTRASLSRVIRRLRPG